MNAEYFWLTGVKFQLKKIQHSILIIVNGDGEVDVVTFGDVVNEM